MPATSRWSIGASSFSGPLDRDYAAASTHIGQVHARIGLAPNLVHQRLCPMLEYVLPKLILGGCYGPSAPRVVRGRQCAGQGVADRHGHRAPPPISRPNRPDAAR